MKSCGLHRVEMDALAARRPPEAEQVRFTAGYPGVISPDPWYPFVAVIHLADLADEVRARLAERTRPPTTARPGPLSRGWGRSSYQSRRRANPCPLRRGPGIQPPFGASDLAGGHSGSDVPLPGATGVGRQGPSWSAGRVPKWTGGGRRPFRLRVRPEEEQDELSEPLQAETGRIFQKVFASYSHLDEKIVNAVVAAYQARDLRLYRQPGFAGARRAGMADPAQAIHPRLRPLPTLLVDELREIAAGGDEWRFAWSLIGQKVESFIRGLTWEESPPLPPPKLRHLQFERLDLRSLLRLAGSDSPTSTTPDASVEVCPVPTAPVVPLVPGTRVADTSAVEGDVRWAVDFLETRTGLRYYPVPTVLVDE